eukprot:1195328-Prorocentrum_minimum.AAC.7
MGGQAEYDVQSFGQHECRRCGTHSSYMRDASRIITGDSRVSERANMPVARHPTDMVVTRTFCMSPVSPPADP